MTLIIGMSKAEGIYMCVDYRVTDGRSGRTLDDAAPKHLQVHYPPLDNGPKALFGYTGVAVLPDGTRTGDWLRETLRGESEVIDASMAFLGERLNRDFARFRQALMVNVLVTEPSGRRLFGGFTNLRKSAFGTVVDPEIHYVMQELDEPFLFFNGSGAFHIDRESRALLERQLRVWPNRPQDHMKLLGIINRRVAARERSVSPFSHIAYINGDNRTQPQSMASIEHGETVPTQFPMLLAGIDLSVMMGQTMGRFEALKADMPPPPEPDVEEVNRQLRRRE
jgi:hypothetical protein